jgi:hypothetical protein
MTYPDHWSPMQIPRELVARVQINSNLSQYFLQIAWQRQRRPNNTKVSCIYALFAWAYQPNLPAIQQCFSLTINQRTVLSHNYCVIRFCD